MRWNMHTATAPCGLAAMLVGGATVLEDARGVRADGYDVQI
jgi:hypothetical protein